MCYYISAFAIYGIALLSLMRVSTRFQTIIFSLGLLPVFLLVVCRGNVGTDTAAYLQIIAQVQDGSPLDMEFGFLLLVKMLLLLDMSPGMILAAIAFISTALLMYAATFSKRSLLVVAFCVVPIFYLDMTMNGLRYGLAFACAMCAVAWFYQGRLVQCFLFSVGSVSFHLSGLFIFVLMAMFSDNRQECKKWLCIGMALFVLVLNNAHTGMSFFVDASAGTRLGVFEYLMMKFEAYRNFPSPNWYSGLAPLLLSMMVLGVIKAGTAAEVVSVRKFYCLLTGVALMFILAKLSYAGLRLQFIFLFFMLLCLQFKPAFACIMNKTQHAMIMRAFLVIAMLGMAMFFKNALASEGQGSSPWFPYSHVFERFDLIKN